MGSLTLAEDGIDTLFGTQDENLRRIERAFKVTLAARGRELRVTGDDPARIAAVERLIAALSAMLDRGYRFRAGEVQTAIRLAQDSPDISLEEFFLGEGTAAAARRIVQPRTANQALYLKAMAEHDIVISIGPAGTGKTFLAVAVGAAALMEKKVRRIVLCRPAVEAGERLGFLPGDLAEKVNPYLRPLYDALNDIIGFEKVARMMERQVIEVAPLAFMRGRTLNESFVILDEAQNTTPEQMKMFLTRLGNGSKAVVNGDITQVDLPAGRTSGLRDARDALQNVEGIKFIHFDERDVVRHELVQRIVGAYDRHERKRDEAEAQRARPRDLVD